MKPLNKHNFQKKDESRLSINPDNSKTRINQDLGSFINSTKIIDIPNIIQYIFKPKPLKMSKNSQQTEQRLNSTQFIKNNIKMRRDFSKKMNEQLIN